MLDGYLWSVSIKYTQYGLCTILVKQWWDPGFNQRGMGGGGGGGVGEVKTMEGEGAGGDVAQKFWR